MRGIAGAPALWLGAACFLVHLVANAHYDVFRDELYFIVCGLHPAFGYVDQPPLIPLIAAASFKLFGTALTPLRLVPALASAATVALTADLARRLGGGRFAQALAGLCVLFAPALLADGVLLSTDCLQPLTWLACAWILVRLVDSGDERWWLAFGAVVGVSFESKYLIALYMAAFAVGVVATPLRRSLARPWLYAGAALALAIALPNVLWQALHGWPFLGVAGADVGGKAVGRSPLGFLLQQALFVGPASAPVWLAGLWRLGVRPPRPELRTLAIAYVVLLAIVVVANGKAYYVTPIYPALFAAGGVAWEAWLKRPTTRGVAIAVVVVPGLFAAPTALPILPPDALVAYMRAVGFSPKATQTESMKLSRAAAVFRRHVRLARDGGGGLRRLSRPAARRARASGLLRAQLRRGRCARRLWTGARRAAGDQRPQFLFPLGAARRVWRCRHHARPRRRAFRPLLRRRSRRRPHRQRVCDALRERPDDLGPAPSARAARRQLERAEALRLSGGEDRQTVGGRRDVTSRFDEVHRNPISDA